MYCVSFTHRLKSSFFLMGGELIISKEKREGKEKRGRKGTKKKKKKRKKREREKEREKKRKKKKGGEWKERGKRDW